LGVRHVRKPSHNAQAFPFTHSSRQSLLAKPMPRFYTQSWELDACGSLAAMPRHSLSFIYFSDLFSSSHSKKKTEAHKSMPFRVVGHLHSFENSLLIALHSRRDQGRDFPPSPKLSKPPAMMQLSQNY